MSGVHENYGIVIDSGSSGSRLQIYKWEDPSYLQKNSKSPEQLRSIPKIIQQEDWSFKTTPGLSQFADKPNRVWDDHFKYLIEQAEKIIPENKISQTPIFVQATAGMRLITEKKKNKVLSEVCKSLKKHSNFMISDCEKQIQVIDGELEGLYGWIGLNYLKGKLDNYDPSLPITDHDSYGFMDMGGASTQISFVPSDMKELQKHQADLYKLKLRNVNGETQDWSVFVSTWLGFGANEARKRHLRNMIYSLPDGVNYDTNGDNTYDLVDPCSPKGMKIEQELNGVNYEITGSGDYKTCLRYIYPLLLKHLPCKDEPCLFNGVHAPTIDFKKDKFVGVSEYWYTANDVFHMGGEYNFLKFEERLKEFCELDWGTIESNFESGVYGSNIEMPLLKDSCFKASWVVNVLHEGFELPRLGLEADELTDKEIKLLDKEDKDHIAFESAKLIDGAELSWTLGKIILHASSQVPSNDNEPVGIIASTSTQYITSSSVINSNNNINNSGMKIQEKDTDVFTGSFLFIIFSLFLFGSVGYALFTKKYSSRNLLNNRNLSPSKLISNAVIQAHKTYQDLKNMVLNVYYERLASSEQSNMLSDIQTNLHLEEGDHPLPQSRKAASFKSLSTLRTRSTLNLQEHDVQHPPLNHSISHSSIFAPTNFSGGSMNTNAESRTPGSSIGGNFDFMGKKYNKYVNTNNSNILGTHQHAAAGSSSHLDLKSLMKSKTGNLD
ncbi:hypothetical protein CANARDRAFT_29692 [[Candida] arabinofermentans NRRL YB-2248]|uniref:Golgi apyrase n=1 Tax=[Candida] arabinofermentans NRRL YB-2248 TaxID=983967 RepID=A0A1E4SW22_9ASCO|nr:hypothetical protein CANARDRAFT_29692 [[Candida] arabinofermentans NRRL YB-2248]